MGKDERDIVGALSPAGGSEWTVTNRVVDRTLDCNSNSALVNGDALGTLIEDLIAQGFLKGAVTA